MFGIGGVLHHWRTLERKLRMCGVFSSWIGQAMGCEAQEREKKLTDTTDTYTEVYVLQKNGRMIRRMNNDAKSDMK
jgi:hypothetical protein